MPPQSGLRAGTWHDRAADYTEATCIDQIGQQIWTQLLCYVPRRDLRNTMILKKNYDYNVQSIIGATDSWIDSAWARAGDIHAL
ncbi:hypothetical protein GCM10027084_16990 [Pseudoxanthomonas sangjuensis]